MCITRSVFSVGCIHDLTVDVFIESRGCVTGRGSPWRQSYARGTKYRQQALKDKQQKTIREGNFGGEKVLGG